MARPRAVLLDIDGVLHVSWKPLPGAVEALQLLRSQGLALRFLTNTSNRSHTSLARDLQRAGLPIAAEELQTAGLAAAGFVRRQRRRSIHLLAAGDVGRDFAGLPCVDSVIGDAGAGWVVVGDAGSGFHYRSLNLAFTHLMAGAGLVAMHANRYYKVSSGLVMDAGAFVKALEFASGKRARVLGKPAPAFFREALRHLGVLPEEAIAVGDDLRADVWGAQRVGLRGGLVRTGKFRPQDLESRHIKPDFVLDSIADLPAYLDGL